MNSIKKYATQKDNDSLEKKLSAYTMLAGAFVAMAPVAKAGIVYTDVDPDEVITTPNFSDTTYALDFNGDGIEDIIFSAKRSYYSPGTSS